MTVLLESIDLLLLQLRVTRSLNQGSARRPTIIYILLKTAYFNYVDISASFKNFVKITPTCFRDHKIGYAAPIYKSIKTVHF